MSFIYINVLEIFFVVWGFFLVVFRMQFKDWGGGIEKVFMGLGGDVG